MGKALVAGIGTADYLLERVNREGEIFKTDIRGCGVAELLILEAVAGLTVGVGVRI